MVLGRLQGEQTFKIRYRKFQAPPNPITVADVYANPILIAMFFLGLQLLHLLGKATYVLFTFSNEVAFTRRLALSSTLFLHTV